MEMSSTWSPNDKADLSQILGRVCAAQRSYGKTAADLETIVECFAWAFKNYPVVVVVEALAKHVLQSSEVPTPFDIRQIIDPIKEPWKPDTATYLRLRKKVEDGGTWSLDADEAAYCRAYEDYMVSRPRN